jgi:2'-5' RNA ligase
MTLRFLGEVDDPAPVIKALDGAALPPARAVLGPTVQMLGERVLMVPVSGLDDLAAAVVEATAAFGDPPEDRAFTGHLTLARLGRGGRPRPACLGEAVAGEWKVDELALVRSHLGNGPARYEDLFLRPLNFSNP